MLSTLIVFITLLTGRLTPADQKMLRLILFAVALVAASSAVEDIYQTFNTDCQSCNPEECPKPTGCVAGVVQDPCGCCEVCGKGEFEMCDHPKVSKRELVQNDLIKNFEPSTSYNRGQTHFTHLAICNRVATDVNFT
jgi:hypothetical protein